MDHVDSFVVAKGRGAASKVQGLRGKRSKEADKVTCYLGYGCLHWLTEDYALLRQIMADYGGYGNSCPPPALVVLAMEGMNFIRLQSIFIDLKQ